MRKVKCQCCGQQIEKFLAFCVTKNKVNKYYCSHTEYENMLAEKETKKMKKIRLYSLINEAFGRKVSNTVLYSEINSILENNEIDDISDYIQENMELIKSSLCKDFKTEYGQIRYFSAIINNHIYDYIKAKKEEQKKEEKHDIKISNYEPLEEYKYKRKDKRKDIAKIIGSLYDED